MCVKIYMNMINMQQGLEIKSEKLNKISKEIIDCKKCILYKERITPVFGIGNNNSDIMFIGEAPGKNEDLNGFPFVGSAGKILDELLQSIDIKREDIYITNILKCRPPKNRNPKDNEIKCCSQYLDKQIEIISPKIISTLGNFSSKYIMEKFNISPENINKIHGKIFIVGAFTTNIMIIPLYHPAAVLYNQNIKKALIEDFKVIDSVLKKID